MSLHIDARDAGGGPSTTAAVVAATQLVLQHDPKLGALVNPDSARLIARALATTYPRLSPLFSWSATRRVLPLALGAERRLSPGFFTYYALRKTGVRAEIQRAVAEGFRQVVLVGAGFDMLSASIEAQDLRVIEVDHPHTRALKRRALGDDARTTSIGVDLLSTRLDESLRAHPPFDPSADTLYVAEGLLMYLPPERIDALFAALAPSDPKARVRFVFSAVAPDSRGQYRIHTQSRVVDLCMKLLNEPFEWCIRPGEIGDFLRARGFALDYLLTTDELRERFLEPSDHARVPRTGEALVVASFVAREV